MLRPYEQALDGASDSWGDGDYILFSLPILRMSEPPQLGAKLTLALDQDRFHYPVPTNLGSQGGSLAPGTELLGANCYSKPASRHEEDLFPKLST